MSSEARALLGDLVVASVEVSDGAADPVRWLVLASAAAAHIDDAPPALRDELFATLVERDLLARVRIPFEEAWPRIAWDRACVMRSGFEALRDILERHAPALAASADMSRVEQRMIQHGETLFVPQQIPAGTPDHHWWWRGGVPPGERAIRMNQHMREVLPPRVHADHIPASFRALVANGFAEDHGMLFFRDRLPRVPAHAASEPHATGIAEHNASWIEAQTNEVRFGQLQVRQFEPGVIELVGGPEPVGATALACARHLAYALRRNHPPCRIIVNAHAALQWIRFHRIRPGEDWVTNDGQHTSFEHFPAPMLVLETH